MRRWLTVIGLAVLALLALGAGLLYWFLSGDGVRRALEQQASQWLGAPVHIGSASAGLYPRVALRLNQVTAGDPVRVTFGQVDLSTDLRALLARRIEAADIVVSRSRIEMPLPFLQPGSPPAGTNAPASTPAATPGMRLVSVRAIAVRDIQLVSRGREILVNGESSLAGTELQVRQFTASSGATTLRASGVVQLEPRIDGRFRVAANRLDLDELLALASAFTPPGPGTGGSAPPLRLAARVSAETARAGGIDVKQFATDLAVDGTAVSLSPMSFEAFGGRYQGSLTGQLGDTLAGTLRARISDVDIAQVASFGGAPQTITGRLSGVATVSGRGRDMAALLRSARGSGTASIVAGSIARLNLIRTVVQFFGRPSAASQSSSGTDRFDRIDVRFSLADEVFRADAFSLHSSDADIVGRGSLDVGNLGLEGGFDLSLSSALSAQAGTDLYRYTHEGDRVVLPARLGGTLSAPSLTIDAAAAVQRGLRNEVQRRLKDILGGLNRER